MDGLVHHNSSISCIKMSLCVSHFSHLMCALVLKTYIITHLWPKNLHLINLINLFMAYIWWFEMVFLSCKLKFYTMQEKVLGILRHVFTFVGGLIVTKGFIDESLYLELSGAVLTLIGGIWSILSKK